MLFLYGMYRILTMLYNYLRTLFIYLTLFIYEFFFFYINVKIAKKILNQVNFKTTLQMDLKSYMNEKITLYPVHCLTSMCR